MIKELMLYIHIPFCVRKCSYCDFLSFAYTEDENKPGCKKVREAYCSALVDEIKKTAGKAKGYLITSVFIGGGTPSLLSFDVLCSIMAAVRDNYSISDDCEITIETNPGTVNRDFAVSMMNAGINRVSIGLQSANDDELKKLGRIHDYNSFVESFKLLRDVGFKNINIDLMCAIPGQSMKSLSHTIDEVTNLAPEHISCYSLIIEPGTPFYEAYEADELDGLPDEDEERELMHYAEATLAMKGYKQYEVSNFSKEGYECRHNVGYWTRRNYIGFGIGAASLFEDVRYKNTDDIYSYIKDPIGSKGFFEELSIEDKMSETMFLGFRMNRGVNLEHFINNYEKSVEEVFEEAVQKNIARGLLEYSEDGEYLRLTKKGFDVANMVSADFLF